MFTDLKGFTERTSRISRTMMRTLLRVHEELVLPIIRRFGGTLVKNIGDAFLVTFESPTNAVLCGLVIQDTFTEYNNHTEAVDEKLEIRIAINSGEVEIRDGDVYGEAVNIAARIESITEVNEVYFTESVYLAMNKHEVPSSEVGLRRLKGIPEEIKIYKVIQDRESSIYKAALISNVAVENTNQALDIRPVLRRSSNNRSRNLFMKAASFIILSLVISTSVYNLHLITKEATQESNEVSTILPSVTPDTTVAKSEKTPVDKLVDQAADIPENRESTDKVASKPAQRKNSQLVNLNCVDEELTSIIQRLASQSETNIIIDSSVKGKYSCFFNNISPQKALRLLVESNGLDMYKSQGIIHISSKTEAEKPADSAPDSTVASSIENPPGIVAPPAEIEPEVKESPSVLAPRNEVKKAPRLIKNRSLASAIRKMELPLSAQDQQILVHLLTKLFKDGEKFYQDADVIAKKFLSWTQDPSKEKMKSIILTSLRNSSEQIRTIEDAIESVKHTTYSKTKWSKVWGDITNNKLGGRRNYRVMVAKTGQVLNIEDFLTDEYNRVKSY